MTKSVSPLAIHVVLCQPEIPPNTGNIIRLCANTGASLHLVEPMGFTMDDTRLKRAGLDYHEYAQVKSWRSLEGYSAAYPERRLVAIETSGGSSHSAFVWGSSDSLLFGSETKGLSEATLSSIPNDQIVRLPMLADSRSLNLSNAVAVVVYEVWRQFDYGFET
jgi:tRNA (cytidine/uridine-2'-O-)-methyltransferase